jgi:hypothetical protein
MKRYIAIISLLSITVGSVIAGIAFLCDAPPSLELIDAYPLAVKALGTNASQYHCVHAMPIDAHVDITNHIGGEWLFDFVATNRTHKTVYVFFDNKAATIEDMNGKNPGF